MALTVVPLTVPSGDGVGPAANVQALDGLKTFVIDGTIGGGETLIIEGTDDPAGLVGWDGIVAVNTGNNGPQVIRHVATFYRVRRQFSVPTNAPSAQVASTTTETKTFFTLVSSAGPGVGAGVNVSAGGQNVSFTVEGAIQPGETIVVEGSQDNISWNGFAFFTSTSPPPTFLPTTYSFLRLRRTAQTTAGGTTITVFAGTTTAPGGGGGTVFGPAPPNIASGSLPGVDNAASRDDHTHGLDIVAFTPSLPQMQAPGIIQQGFSSATSSPSVLTVGTDLVPFGDGTGTVTTDASFSRLGINATWPIATTRFFAVDGILGNDTNLGYSDVTMAAAGIKAKKTIAALAIILPVDGLGRKAEVAIKSTNYAEDIGLLFNGRVGYSNLCVRGTDTNATAASVAFAGDAADATFVGGVTVTGLNAPGYNPIGAPTNLVVQLQKAGGGAAALPAEPAAPLGWRVRFDSATTTVALRNICRQVMQVAGTDTVSLSSILPAVPVAADICYLEQAGVVFTVAGVIADCVPTINGRNQIVGIRNTGTVTVAAANLAFAFCGGNALLGNTSCRIANNITYTSPSLGALTPGSGFRAETAISLTDVILSTNIGLVSGTTLTVTNSTNWSWSTGCVTGTSTTLINVRDAASAQLVTQILGSTATIGAPRALGAVILRSCSGLLGNFSITGALANPALSLQGMCDIQFGQGGTATPTGATNNNDVGMDLQGAVGCRNGIPGGVVPTLTGGLGNVRLANGTIITWTTLATGLVDYAGNQAIDHNGNAGGSTHPPCGKLCFTGLVLGGVGATFSYLTGDGLTGAVNQLIALRRMLSRTTVVRVACTVLLDTSVNATTLTLFKNNVATGIVVNIPAATAANTKFNVTAAGGVFYTDNDDFDLRLDDGAGDAGGQVQVSATLEYAM
jgi:hypothetical protein